MITEESNRSKEKVCVVGLGYVGLPVALLAAKRGHIVFGFDIDQYKISELNSKRMPFNDTDSKDLLHEFSENILFSSDPAIIRESKIIIVCVPTPVDKQNIPDLSHLTGAVKTIAENLSEGALIVIESTIFPGTTEELILPILENGTNNLVGTDFFLAHCPERIDPGNEKYTIRNIPRILGGITDKCTQKAFGFYQGLIDTNVTTLETAKAAESTKVVENIFRDVNIALVNELAMSFDTMGIDLLEVIKGASTKPFAFMPHFPGCGVGGHCIPVDPYYLIDKSKSKGYFPKFLSMAREINEKMPIYTIQRVTSALLESGRGFHGAKICVLGLSYKPDVEDIRESPAFKIIELLEKENAIVDYYDPYVLEKSTIDNLDDALSNKDCVIITTGHKEFKNITPQKLKEMNVKIVIDGRNCLNKSEIINAGIIYKGIGR